MDTNLPENLDPKLKEAYERMMGQKPITPVLQDQPTQEETQNIDSQNQQTSQSQEPAHDAYGNITQQQPAQHLNLEEPQHQGHKMLTRVIFIGGIFFLIIYTIIWAKIINLI